jgi:hypothetical protein
MTAQYLKHWVRFCWAHVFVWLQSFLYKSLAEIVCRFLKLNEILLLHIGTRLIHDQFKESDILKFKIFLTVLFIDLITHIWTLLSSPVNA